MENNQSNTRRTKIFVICGVILFSAVTASWTLSERPLNNHECFVSIAAREMLESGEWIVPTYNGEPRLQKTPLSYWLVAGLAQITGQVDEFTARMPSVIFAVLSVAAVMYFVNQWLSFRIAILSAAVWATSLGYIRYSHNARPEMALTFLIMLCFLSFYSAITANSRKRQVAYMLIFWTSFGVANLAKGPAPLPLVLMPLFFYVAVFRQWKQIPKLLPIIGMVIFLAIVLPWPLAVAYKMDWNLATWKHEFVDRFFGTYASGHKPLYYYLPKMFQFTMPWAAFVPFALAAPFYAVWNKKQTVMKFLWLWFVVDLAFLTISGGKRQHYIMPMIPAMCILTGILFEDMAFVKKAFTPRFAKNFLRIHIIVVLIASAVVLTGLVYIAIAKPTAAPTSAEWTSELLKKVAWINSIPKILPGLLSMAIVLTAIQILIVIAVAVLFAKGKRSLACGTIFVGIATLVMISYVSFINPLNYNQPSRQFTQTVAQKVPAPDKLIAYKSASARFIHYFGRRVPKIGTKSEVYELYEKGGWVVAFGTYLDELLDNGDFEIVYVQENAERHGQNIVGGALLHKSGGGSKDEI